MNKDNKNLLADKQDTKKHNKKLNDLLSAFFSFLSRSPKPSDEEIRTEFQHKEADWKLYCIQHKLDIRTSMLFNAKVSYEWERKQVKESNI